MGKFTDRFRIETTRLRDWDYSASGWYFVTMCTRNQVPYFGEVLKDKVDLSSPGVIASLLWLEIPEHHAGVELDEFIIMPNHVHGVIILLGNKGDSQRDPVETLHAASVQLPIDQKMADISPRKGSLPVVVRSYKSAVTRWARQNGYEDFAWQARYYDHIIRSQEALRKIRTYIQENPLKWALDRYYLRND